MDEQQSPSRSPVYDQDGPQSRAEGATAPIRLGACHITIEPQHVSTRLPGGREVLGMPMSDAGYRRTAREHGYGEDVARMCRCHEVTHSLIAHWLGLPCSPVFRRVAGGDHEADDLTRVEEAAVLALEAYANAMGVDLVEVAKGWAK